MNLIKPTGNKLADYTLGNLLGDIFFWVLAYYIHPNVLIMMIIISIYGFYIKYKARKELLHARQAIYKIKV